jgi:hypothetical protein
MMKYQYSRAIKPKAGFVRTIMRIEISCEPMRAEDIEEAAEALAAIIVRHLSADCPSIKSEREQEKHLKNQPNKSNNN